MPNGHCSAFEESVIEYVTVWVTHFKWRIVSMSDFIILFRSKIDLKEATP